MPLTLNDSHFLSFNLLKPSCPWDQPPHHHCLIPYPPPHLSSLHPSFALLLSPGGNYLHKSFFALWFAPFHKWRLSLFNRSGFASHVKAYNVAGPWFLQLLWQPPPPFFPVGLSLLGREEGGGGGTPRLRLTGPEEASAVDQASDSLTWLKGDQEVVKNHLW